MMSDETLAMICGVAHDPDQPVVTKGTQMICIGCGRDLAADKFPKMHAHWVDKTWLHLEGDPRCSDCTAAKPADLREAGVLARELTVDQVVEAVRARLYPGVQRALNIAVAGVLRRVAAAARRSTNVPSGQVDARLFVDQLDQAALKLDHEAPDAV